MKKEPGALEMEAAGKKMTKYKAKLREQNIVEN